MSPAQLGRGHNWTEEEEQRLLRLIAAGKSWVLISASLSRNIKAVQYRAQLLKRQFKRTSEIVPRPESEER